jgi:lysophospholipase L1-like esterase
MKLPKVMLLGDSIRMSYQPLVADLLAGKAEVVGPAVNGRFSLFTLTSIPEWVGALGRPDVIHWNNGIHDAGYNPGRAPVQIPLEDYVGNVQRIVNHVRSNLTPKLIFATSTPPHPDKPFSEKGWGWKQGDIERYNEAAKQVMANLSVQVNDLHGLVSADPNRLLCDDQLHLSEEGKKLCAEAVAKCVTGMLGDGHGSGGDAKVVGMDPENT